MLKNIGKNSVSKGLPAAIGGAAAVLIESLTGKYAPDNTPDWLKPLVPGLVGIAVMDGKNKMRDYAGAGAIGYAVGCASKDKIVSMLGDEFVADDLEDFLNDENATA